MSVGTDTNTVILGYGEFDIVSIAQSGSGNVVTVSEDDMPIEGDYFYSEGNSNGTSTFVLVTEILSDTTFSIDLTSGSGTVTGGTFSKAKELDVYFADDEGMMIEQKKKVRLDKVILENIVGGRAILQMDFEPFTEAERLFMYQFVQSDVMRAKVLDVLYSDVVLESEDVVLDLLDGLIFATGLKLSLMEREVTAPSAGSFTPGETSSAGYYASSPDGTRVRLTMNYGTGDIMRNFTVNLADPYSVQVSRKDYRNLDDSIGRVNFGIRGSVRLDFGAFGYSPAPSDINTDLTWLKAFVLAPVKKVEVYNLYQMDVVNDFDRFTVGYLSGFIKAKTVSLSFVGRSVVRYQTPQAGTFTLDSDTLGLLDGEARLS